MKLFRFLDRRGTSKGIQIIDVITPGGVSLKGGNTCEMAEVEPRTSDKINYQASRGRTGLAKLAPGAQEKFLRKEAFNGDHSSTKKKKTILLLMINYRYVQ